MKIHFPESPRPAHVPTAHWLDWKWQMRHCLQSLQDYQKHLELTEEEVQGFAGTNQIFQVKTTPYYMSLAHSKNPEDPIRKILVPRAQELASSGQQLLDPLGENSHSPVPRIVHRYPDRVLFLVTDLCSVYCRYCTRKYFTGKDKAFMSQSEYQTALEYIRKTKGLREVILSGGDPLTLGDHRLDQILTDLRAIEHVEIIRVGSRMPVVCPMRITPELVKILHTHAPVFLMTHFNHPRELTMEAAIALEKMVDHGIPVMNQMVLLNGVNNHPAHVQALSRRLLYLRVKPYYMFQCDPSQGTDHLRTSITNSLDIQKQLWGRLSGLAMPNLSVDIPGGGGKVGLVPDFSITESSDRLDCKRFRGWDGIEADYEDPAVEMKTPVDVEEYLPEWESIQSLPAPKP